MTDLSVFKGDITELSVGAIVNAANSALVGGSGVDGAIHRVGGPAIMADCQAVIERQGACQPGDAVVTGAGELPAGIVIHTVGPIWSEDNAEAHDEVLAQCYSSSLDLALKHRTKEIAFPNISTGAYGFPKTRAAIVAINSILDWLENNLNHDLNEVVFVCFDDENHELYESLLGW